MFGPMTMFDPSGVRNPKKVDFWMDSELLFRFRFYELWQGPKFLGSVFGLLVR